MNKKTYRPVLITLGFLLLLFVADRIAAALLRMGLERYFGFNRPAQVLCVGHSRTVLGIDRSLLEKLLGVPVAKYGLDGVNTFDRSAMVHLFAAKHPELRVVIYDVEGPSFTTANLSQNSYKLFLPFMNEPLVKEYIKDNTSDRLHFFIYQLLHTSRYDDAMVNRSIRGWLGFDENLKRGNVDLVRLRQRIKDKRIRPVRIDKNNLECFDELMHWLTERKIKVVLWQPPTIDILDEINHDQREKVRDLFRNRAAADPAIFYFEYLLDYRSKYDIFYDGIHLNSKGRGLITARLAEDIKAANVLGK